MIFTVGILLALLIATRTDHDLIARVVGFSVLAAIVLYEPFFVSRFGGTIGHTRQNICVVDDRTGRNIGFGKAILRFLIKALLGWWSFITMLTTKRHQAVHDALTRSTVRIRDASLARQHHFVTERAKFEKPGWKAMLWRMLMVCVYVILSFVVVGGIDAGLQHSGVVSGPCVSVGRCGEGERILSGFLLLGWFATMLWVVYRGLRGQLYGCRGRRGV